jgi:hypothetical protein
MAKRDRGSKNAAKRTAVPPKPRATGRPKNNPKKRHAKYKKVISSILIVSPLLAPAIGSTAIGS